MDLYEFYSGRCFDAYNELGAHVVKENVGKSRRKAVTGVDFVTYAPNAESVTVTGEFNSWGETAMERCYDGSFFKCFVPGSSNAAPAIRFPFLPMVAPKWLPSVS